MFQDFNFTLGNNYTGSSLPCSGQTAYLYNFRDIISHIIDKSWCLNCSYVTIISIMNVALSKIEKVPRDIRGEKSSKDMASSRNLVSTIGALASPKLGDGTRCPEG